MTWFSRHTNWLFQETQRLATSSIYRQEHQCIDRTLISIGQVIVHKEKTTYHPILIIYPDATPYIPPRIYTLRSLVDEQTAQRYASLAPEAIPNEIRDKIAFFQRRHQGPDGSVCFLEAGDLHAEQAEAYPINDILRRLMTWLSGRIPKDSPEVELFNHFQYRATGVQCLLPDLFFDQAIVRGTFFANTSPFIVHSTYIGTAIIGETAAGVTVLPKCAPKRFLLFAPTLNLEQLLIEQNRHAIDEEKKAGRLIEGHWWDINREPEPFTAITAVADYIGPDVEQGFTALVKAFHDPLSNLEDTLYLGLRFPGRHRERDWQLFRLKRQVRPTVVEDTPSELKERLSHYQIEAVKNEYLTDDYFHLRNRGRAERNILKKTTLSLIGLGAIGSETADALCKAGVGAIILVDKEAMRAHNAIRHCLGIDKTGVAKTDGMDFSLYLHNPFVPTTVHTADILTSQIGDYLPPDTIGVSTIADDNVEAYLNEKAITTGKTIFYCRGLRGGTAARIFRVIPHKDACKTCISLYRRENSALFTEIPEDESLPVITNECNNPVRPASAADGKIIAGLFARTIVDYLHGTNLERNHWIWQNGRLRSSTIPPHPACPTCQELQQKKVTIAKDVYDFVKSEAASSGTIETGGVLLGHRATSDEYVVLRASGPGPNSVRTPYRFKKMSHTARHRSSNPTKTSENKDCILASGITTQSAETRQAQLISKASPRSQHRKITASTTP